MKTYLFALLIVFATSIVFAADEQNEIWLTNFDEAKVKAQKEKKDIYLLFTGSDWCHYCQVLHEQILSKDEFAKGVQEDFILVKADFPRYKEQSAELKARNRQLQSAFVNHGFTGYPTVFLCDVEGNPYHNESGFSGETVDSYLKSMTEKKDFVLKVRTIVKESKGKQDEAFAKKLDAVFEQADYEAVMNTYQDEMRMIMEAVGSNHPLYTKYSRYLSFDDKVQSVLQKLAQNNDDTKAIAAYLDEQLADPNSIKPEQQLLHYFYSYIYQQDKEYQKAIDHLEKAIAAYPHSSKARAFEGFMDQLKEDVKN